MGLYKPGMEKWLLPPAIDDLLPPHAEKFSVFQQQIMQVIRSYGYQLIHPPLVEYADSLNLGESADLGADMARFADYPNGGELGLRADFTPQAARIDARLMEKLRCNRLCYCGETFRLGNNNSAQGRSSFHIGAELFGEESIRSDMEIIDVALDCFTALKLAQPILFLSHATFARLVLQRLGLTATLEREYLTLLARKSQDYIVDLLDAMESGSISREDKQLLSSMPRLYGDKSIITKAGQLIAHLDDDPLAKILREIRQVVARFKDRTTIYIDLGEMPGNGYSYHNGLVFGLYFADQPQCFAEGGRYDSIGSQYGKNGKGRPATGFSLDARKLFAHYIQDASAGTTYKEAANKKSASKSIYVPYTSGSAGEDETLEIARLRKQGKVVIKGLSPSHNSKHLNCGYELVKKGKKWQVVPLDK